MPEETYKRIGHKGAHTLVPGNTLESFEAAVEEGVDVIEFDVLRDRDGRLVIAHDYHDASLRQPLGLIDALDAFCEPPLDQVDFDCDLKLPGREAELAGTLAGHDLLDRAMVSTMEIESLVKLRKLEPELRLGWTVPKTRRDWTGNRWAGPAVVAALAAMRRRLPKTIAARAPALDLNAIWAYHRLVTPRLVEVAHDAGLDLMAWTVDERKRITQLAEMGVDGIASNDPRLFKGEVPSPAQDDGNPRPEDAEEIAQELAGEPEPEVEPESKANAKPKPKPKAKATKS
jgi:glycerophosphoryl diester phosphodiesterase